jgi:predicted Zn-dependent peptidase
VILEEIKMVEDTPDDLVGELFLDAFWAGHPLGRPILGTDTTVRRLTRSNIEAHYRETFHPTNVIFAASGRFDPDRLVKVLDRAFGSVAGSATRHDWDAPKPIQHVTLRRKSELEQVHVFLGMRGYPQQADERFAAAIYNMILGGGMSSRLFQNIREKEGLVYTVSSYHSGYLHGGYEAIYAATNPNNLERVLELTLGELRNLKRDGVTAKELENAKRAIKGSILLSLESTVSRMSGLARQEYYFGRQFTPDEIIDRIEAVGIEDIRRIADATVDPDSISLTLLGNLDDPGVSVEDLRSSVA